jgi:phenylalanyl-tRNA synthetase alpha chain
LSQDAGSADIPALLERFREAAEAVDSRDSWEALRVEWLGRKRGVVRTLEGRLRSLPPEQKRDFGRALHELRQAVQSGIEGLDGRLADRERASELARSAVDVTLPGRRQALGTLHPITVVFHEIEQIFRQMGYSVAEGPEIEDDYHNFEALNFPPDHPARDEQDTLMLADGRLLRTHTSPIQIRTMLARKPPIRVLGYGRVYRNDNTLRHSPMFHQVEALVVDRGITFGHLKGAVEAFFQRLFSADTEVRFRPSFFPFTEPSAEVDITCPFCRPPEGDRASCGTCSGTGWMEIMGSGMVDPRVLENCGLDPDVYSGFAFGGGIDRVAMARYGLPNIRMLFENDERLLRQVHR